MHFYWASQSFLHLKMLTHILPNFQYACLLDMAQGQLQQKSKKHAQNRQNYGINMLNPRLAFPQERG